MNKEQLALTDEQLSYMTARTDQLLRELNGAHPAIKSDTIKLINVYMGLRHGLMFVTREAEGWESVVHKKIDDFKKELGFDWNDTMLGVLQSLAPSMERVELPPIEEGIDSLLAAYQLAEEHVLTPEMTARTIRSVLEKEIENMLLKLY